MQFRKTRSRERDEDYVIGLCDKALGRTAARAHRFPFLRGDSGRPLPVDGYYEDIKLVIEYRERQHTESVPLFDRKPTISGVSRGEQRALYDQRRRDELPKHGLALVEFEYSDFSHDSRKRLKRIPRDLAVVRDKLRVFASAPAYAAQGNTRNAQEEG